MSEPIVPARPVPTSGGMLTRVRYCECDPMGVAHHGSYIAWLEMGRTELLREAGVSYAQLEAAGVFLVIVKAELSYRRPAYYDDLVEIRTRVVGGSRVKIRHEYELYRAESSDAGRGSGGITPARGAQVGDLIATAATLLACVDAGGRPAPLPDWLGQAGG